MRLLLGAQRGQPARHGVEVQRLLHHRLAGLDQRGLALDLRVDAPLEEAERVHVLELGLGAQLGAAGRADGDVGVAAQRALLHVHVAHAELAQRHAQQVEPLARLLGGAQVGLGDDLGQRRAAAVVVDDRRVGAVDAARLPQVHELGRVLLEVDAVQPHVAQLAARAERDVVLGDLVALGEVGIEVVLAVEDRPRGDLRAQREAHHQPEVDGLGVGHRQRAGQPEADRARARVRLLAEAQLAAAEHLRARGELDVDLQPDDGFERSCAGRRSVEADRLLERVRRVEDAVLAERRARRSGSRPAGPPRARWGSRWRGCRRATSAPCSSR